MLTKVILLGISKKTGKEKTRKRLAEKEDDLRKGGSAKGQEWGEKEEKASLAIKKIPHAAKKKKRRAISQGERPRSQEGGRVVVTSGN